jgi:hypothetical protein
VLEVTSQTPRNALTNIKNTWESVMNHSIYGADRATHLKIVVVGLLCAILVAAIGTFAHVSDVDLGTTQLVKAGQPTTVTGQLPAIR